MQLRLRGAKFNAAIAAELDVAEMTGIFTVDL